MSEFGSEYNCEKDDCKKSFAFGGRSHCRQCRKAFCQKHIHTNNSVDKKSKFFKMCENCKNNNSNISTTAAVAPVDEDVENDSVWGKGKKLFDDM